MGHRLCGSFYGVGDVSLLAAVTLRRPAVTDRYVALRSCYDEMLLSVVVLALLASVQGRAVSPNSTQLRIHLSSLFSQCSTTCVLFVLNFHDQDSVASGNFVLFLMLLGFWVLTSIVILTNSLFWFLCDFNIPKCADFHLLLFSRSC